MKKFNFRRAFGGGASVTEHVMQYEELISQLSSQEAKQLRQVGIAMPTTKLRHYGTKVVSGIKGVRTIRRKDDKFETEKVVLVDSSDEYASIAEKGGKLPRTILLNEKENNTNFKKYGVW